MFGSSGGNEARYARQEEEGRQRRVKAGTEGVRKRFGESFDDKYYSDLMDATLKRYTPQLDMQKAEGLQGLQAALMRSGLFDSSIASQKTREAGTKYDLALQDIKERGIGYQNQRKQDVAFAENTVLNQLTNTGDMAGAFNQAASQIKTNYANPSMPMLGQVFTDLSAGLATQADLERNGQARYNVFGRIPGWSNGGANRYTRNVGGT